MKIITVAAVMVVFSTSILKSKVEGSTEKVENEGGVERMLNILSNIWPQMKQGNLGKCAFLSDKNSFDLLCGVTLKNGLSSNKKKQVIVNHRKYIRYLPDLINRFGNQTRSQNITHETGETHNVGEQNLQNSTLNQTPKHYVYKFEKKYGIATYKPDKRDVEPVNRYLMNSMIQTRTGRDFDYYAEQVDQDDLNPKLVYDSSFESSSEEKYKNKNGYTHRVSDNRDEKNGSGTFEVGSEYVLIGKQYDSGLQGYELPTTVSNTRVQHGRKPQIIRYNKRNDFKVDQRIASQINPDKIQNIKDDNIKSQNLPEPTPFNKKNVHGYKDDVPEKEMNSSDESDYDDYDYYDETNLDAYEESLLPLGLAWKRPKNKTPFKRAFKLKLDYGNYK